MPTASPVSTAELVDRSEKSARITELDVLRGFALFGITLVNTVGITGMPTSGPAVGIVVLLPASFLPGWRFILALGGAATAAAAVTAGGGMLIPGLFLVGFGAARYGVEKLLGLPTSRICIVLGVTATLAVALNAPLRPYNRGSAEHVLRPPLGGAMVLR